MLRKILGFTALFLTFALLVLACKADGEAAAGDGGAPAKPKKLMCRMEGQCWVCPDEAAIKKCIINPVTSGCTKAESSACE